MSRPALSQPTILVRAVAAAMLLLAILAPALAQSGLVAEQRATIERLGAAAERLEKEVARDADNDARLSEIRLEAEELAQAALKSGVAFRPRLSEINSRLEQLGPAPGQDQPAEPPAVARERTALLNEKAEINALLGEAENISLEVNRLVDRVATMRRDLFANTLSKRYPINLDLFGQVARQFADETEELYQTVSSWLRFTLRFKSGAAVGATFLALLAAAVLLIGGRRLFGGLIIADPAREDPSYLSRLSVALWSTLLPATALGVFLSATFFLYQSFGIRRPDIGQMMLALFNVVLLVYFVYRLASAALSPRLPNWRLIDIEDHAARFLVWLISLTAVINGIDFLLGAVNEVMGAPVEVAVVKSLVATVLVGVLVILIGRVRPYPATPEHPVHRPWPIALRYLLYLLGVTTIAAALLGYIGFARFVSQQIVITGAILATMYIGLLSAGALSEEGAFARTALGRRMAARWSLSDAALDQIGLAGSVAINLFVLFWGIPLILLQWGFQWGEMQAWLYRIATEVRVGSITISLVGILTGVLVFVLGYLVTRWFQRWLDGKVMARGRVDSGVRNSIRTAIGYAGVAVAALIGISAAGIDLSNLALVAGALSLGIGFGLQNVVSNFVSGLILLAERPFKVGDWIIAGATSGTVKKISVRATEIETFQRQTVILPNSELINSAVGNWTHRNKLGRIDINVPVAYDQDAQRAHEILREIASSHPMVLKNPEPFVLFSNFGPAALEFQIRIFMADVLASNQVHNDIRFAILERFAREGIEMPSTPRAAYPAREPEPELHVEELPAEPKPAQTPKRGRRRVDPDPAES